MGTTIASWTRSGTNLPAWPLRRRRSRGGQPRCSCSHWRISAPRSWRVVTFLTALITLIAALAAICAVMVPSTAGGLLILLWLSWLVVLPIYLWLTLVERRLQRLPILPDGGGTTADWRPR